MYELKEKAFMGILWKGGNFFISQIILLIVKIILVRLLVPEEFGLAGMAYVVISSLSILNSFSTGTAFVRDNKSKQIVARNTLFYVNAVPIILIAVIGFFSAPYVALFFGKKIEDPAMINSLVWMIRALSLSSLIHLLSNVPNAILNKNLKFQKLAVASSSGVFSYGLVVISLGLLGFGPWAIIAGQIASRIFTSLFIFIFSPFFPSLILDKKLAKDYIIFGSNNFVNSLIGVVVTNGDDTLLARLVGAAALGFYSLGQHFAGLAVSAISGVINGVMFPILSKVQDNKVTYSKAFFKAFRLTNLITIPAIGGAVILAHEIVILIFGEKWLPIIPVFYILSIAALLNNFVGLAGPVLNSLNKPQILRNNKLIQFCFFVILIYPFTKKWGMLGVSWVMVIFSIVSLIHLMPILSHEVHNFYRYLFTILSRIIPCTVFMMVIVYYAKSLISINIFTLFFLVFLGILVYFIPMWFLDKDLKWDFREGIIVLKSKLFR